MTMPLDRLINILVTVTLIEMMVTIGLRMTFAELLDTARSWRLVRACLCWPTICSFRQRPSFCSSCSKPARWSPSGFSSCGLPRRALRPAVCGDRASERARRSRLDGDPGGIIGDRFALLLKALLPQVTGSEAPRIDVIGIVKRPARHAADAPASWAAGEAPASHARRETGGSARGRQQDLKSGRRGAHPDRASFMLTEIRLRGFIGMLVLLAATLVIGWLCGAGGRAKP